MVPDKGEGGKVSNRRTGRAGDLSQMGELSRMGVSSCTGESSQNIMGDCKRDAGWTDSDVRRMAKKGRNPEYGIPIPGGPTSKRVDTAKELSQGGRQNGCGGGSNRHRYWEYVQKGWKP